MRKNILGLLSLMYMTPFVSHAGAPDSVQEIEHSVSKSQQPISPLQLNALTRIPLGGIEQTILIQGKKESNPVLLFLRGGPGVPIIPFVHDVDPYAKLQK